MITMLEILHEAPVQGFPDDHGMLGPSRWPWTLKDGMLQKAQWHEGYDVI